MKNDLKIGIALYAIADYMAALLAWFLFLYYRKNNTIEIDFTHFLEDLSSKDIFFTLLLVPISWLILHLFSGAYFNPYRKSRFIEIYRTLIISILGSFIFYFLFILNDTNKDYSYYTKSFFIYFIIQYFLTTIGRILVLRQTKNKINQGKFGYNTLIIGGNQQAIGIYKDIKNNEVNLGYTFKGFVYADDSGANGMSAYLPKLGSINELEKIIDEHHIEEVIIAIDTSEHNKLQYILAQLSHRKIIIKITPDLYDIISGSVKTSNVFAAILIEIYPELMPDWQRVIKRALDIFISLMVLIFLSPLYLFSAIKVKLSSQGSIFYKQKRIGLYGKPFWIYKFRSMMPNAEDNGPSLSSENDPRITKWGRVMRKWRIDELPQFFNIIKGDMSLVGPRPERKYYIDIISQTHPHYKYLHKVKPGLSSWGMVKFGYAENTSEMIERMRYDLLYIKNCSLVLDFKIMIYTILVILQGRGK
ncbi:MAG TPA: sugar transferase [Chitinophagaceae bacterium]|jgi:exopolysaccharide biosynthesis polyprenyl glycosylphosphotransferase|nr:sugar transferase [Chitinophagaceae bacterium]